MAASYVVAAQRANAAAGPLTGALSQKALQVARVKTCYRIALKSAFSDHGPYFKTEFWEKMQLADDVRHLFEKNRHITDPAQIDNLVNQVYEFIKNEPLLASSPRYLPIMAPGGTSWQRNIPPSLEMVNQHAQTEAEVLESWDRYEVMQQRWQAEDAALGEKLFLDDAGWREQIPALAGLLRETLAAAKARLSRPLSTRLQTLEENNKLLLAVHDAIPHSMVLQTELGDGPMPFVQYARALRWLRALVDQRKAGAELQAAVDSLPPVAGMEVDPQELAAGRYETPAETARWQGVSAKEALGELALPAGTSADLQAEVRQALEQISLEHLPADQVGAWLPQLSRLQLVSIGLRGSAFREVDREFRAAEPARARPLEALVAEAKAMRESIMERGEDLYMDAKLGEFRRAIQQQQVETDRLRVRDVISIAGVLLGHYQEYLALHLAVQYAEHVLGRSVVPDAEDPAVVALASLNSLRPQVVQEAARAIGAAGYASPRPIAFSKENELAIWVDWCRLRAAADKLRAEALEIAARHNDPNWLQQHEQARVARYQEVVARRRQLPAFADLHGARASRLVGDYSEAPAHAPLEAAELRAQLQLQYPGVADVRRLYHALYTPPESWQPEELDTLVAKRAVALQAVEALRQKLPAWDAVDTSSGKPAHNAYLELYEAVRQARELIRDDEMRALQLEYSRRNRLETLSSQVYNLGPKVRRFL